MPSVSDYIKLSANEDIIKEYRGFEMKKPQKASLFIAVTSKRLIFYGMTKAASKMNRPSFTQDMKIEDIRGLEIYEKKPVNFFIAFFGAVIFAAGLFGVYSPTTSIFFTLNTFLGNQLYGGLAVALAGLIAFLLSFAAGFKEASIVIKGKNENLNTGSLQDRTVIKWGSESQKILCELGSVILDIQDGARNISNAYAKDYYQSYEAGEDYDDVFENKEELAEKPAAPKSKIDYSGISDDEEEIEKPVLTNESHDSAEVYDSEEREVLGKELGTGSKRDDYLF